VDPQYVWRNHSLKDIVCEAHIIGRAGHEWQIARGAYNFSGYAGAERWYREVARLLRMLAKAPPRCVLEIGVGHGASMFAWAQVSARNALLVGVDNFGVKTLSSVGKPLTAGEVRERLYASGVLRKSQRLELISGNSHSPKVKQSVLRALGGREVNFLFIDGDHSYEGVRQDYGEYSPLVREGGLIAFHDIVPDSKTRYGIDTGVWAGGVYKFWDQIGSEYRGTTIIDRADQDGCGIGVIRARKVRSAPLLNKKGKRRF
jgi:cephalosporin hydroxylase